MFAFCQQYTTSLKSPAIVGGIVAILCLQLAFTISNSTGDLASQSLLIVLNADAHIRPILAHPIIGPAKLHSEDFVPARVSDESRYRSDRLRSIIPTSKVNSAMSERITTSPTRKPLPESPKQAITPKDSTEHSASRYIVKIEDPYSPSSYQSYEVTVAEVSVKPRAEKRTLIAKALPIVKKPYKWVKAIGSKLF